MNPIIRLLITGVPTWLKKSLKKMLGMSSPIDITTKKTNLKKQLISDPGNSHLYYQLGLIYLEAEQFFPAIALFRSALSLGDTNLLVSFFLAQSYLKLGVFDLASEVFYRVEYADIPGVNESLNACFKNNKELKTNTWEPEQLGYGKFQRLRKMVDSIKKEKGGDLKVVDIGGGNGEAALFLPSCDYLLVEPSITGIAGPILPFADKNFDIAICTDVLEHISKNERLPLLSEIIRITSRNIYLTIPLGELNRDVDRFFFDITQNHWTAEHLAFDFSTIEEIKAFLQKNSIEYRVSPISFLPVNLAMSLINNYFLKNDPVLFKKINTFFNSQFSELNEKEPSYGYLVEILLH